MMKRRFTEVVDMIEFNELVNMKRDIDRGGIEIERVITQRLKEELKKHETCCTTCNSKINPYSTSNFTLIFGPEDLKKKASFCALDCLEYFMKNLKDLRRDWKNEKPKPTPETDASSFNDSNDSDYSDDAD